MAKWYWTDHRGGDYATTEDADILAKELFSYSGPGKRGLIGTALSRNPEGGQCTSLYGVSVYVKGQGRRVRIVKACVPGRPIRCRIVHDWQEVSQLLQQWLTIGENDLDAVEALAATWPAYERNHEYRNFLEQLLSGALS